MNWKYWSKMCLLASIVFFCWSMAPWAKCAATKADEAELNGLSSDEEFNQQVRGNDQYRDDTDHDLERVSGAKGFLGDFFGGTGICWESDGFLEQEVWKQGATGGLFFLWIFLGWVGREAYKKQVRDEAKKRW